jgi:N-acyl-phosphatidylethanolamine-hydrolysing phospholipase D
MGIVGCASVALLAVILMGCFPGRPFDEEAWRRRVEATRASDLRAPHRDAEGRFFNPWDPQRRSFGAFLRWRLSRAEQYDRAPTENAAPSVTNDGKYLADPNQPPSVTHVGHATFAIQWDGQVVLTDPFLSARAAIVKRLVPPAFGPERIPAGSVVVISHNHYDHLDSESIEALASKARFLCPLGLGEFLRSRGATDVQELDWWESREIEGTRLTCLPVQHWSRRLGQGYNETLWCSWLIERKGHQIYFGGDSGYFKGFREFGRLYPRIDVALLGVGAFEPRWFMHYAHMNIPEVLKAFEELGAKTLVPTQWGVLKLGDEPAAEPVRVLKRALAAQPELRPRVRILPVGGRLLLD